MLNRIHIHAIFITDRALVLIMHDTLHIQAPTLVLKMWNSVNRLDAINNYVTVIGDCSYVFISINEMSAIKLRLY